MIYKNKLDRMSTTKYSGVKGGGMEATEIEVRVENLVQTVESDECVDSFSRLEENLSRANILSSHSKYLLDELMEIIKGGK